MAGAERGTPAHIEPVRLRPQRRAGAGTASAGSAPGSVSQRTGAADAGSAPPPLDELDDRWQALYPVIPDEAEIDEDAFNAPLAALKDEVNTLLVAYGRRLAKFELFVTNFVQLDEIVRDVVGDLATMAGARRVEVRLSISPELPAVCGDPDRLREAVQQLLHNAIKFNKIGGSVTLTCAVQGDDVALSLVDTGVGIPRSGCPACGTRPTVDDSASP